MIIKKDEQYLFNAMRTRRCVSLIVSDKSLLYYFEVLEETKNIFIIFLIMTAVTKLILCHRLLIATTLAILLLCHNLL